MRILLRYTPYANFATFPDNSGVYKITGVVSERTDAMPPVKFHFKQGHGVGGRGGVEGPSLEEKIKSSKKK